MKYEERPETMHQVTLEEAKTQLTDLIEVALNGEEIYIIKDDEQRIKFVPIAKPKPKGRPQFGSAKGLITMTDDFDDPLEDFKDDM